ncbi:MAG: hypothetical protein ACXAC7_12925 [Candidatus Hodarchaeales archaeon]|jgi:hypothetical protein
MDYGNPFQQAEYEWKKTSTNQAFVSTIGQLYVKRYPAQSFGSDSATALQKSIYEGSEDVHAFNAEGIRQTIIDRIKSTENRGYIRPWYTQVAFWAEQSNLLRGVSEEDIHFLLHLSLKHESKEQEEEGDEEEAQLDNPRNKLRLGLDPTPLKNPDGTIDEFELQKLIRDKITLYARPIIELYGCLKEIIKYCFPLKEEDIWSIIKLFFDSNKLDMFFRKRFIPFEEGDSKKKVFPLIGETHTHQRFHEDFILKYIGMEEDAFFKERVLQLWIFALFYEDSKAREYIISKKYSLISDLNNWADKFGNGNRLKGYYQIVMQAIQLHKLTSTFQVFLHKIRREYAKKSLFSSYVSELNQLLKLRNEAIISLEQLELPFPIDNDKYSETSILRQLGLFAIESEIDKLIERIPIPKGSPNSRMILSKRITNLRKNVSPLRIQNELIGSFASIGSYYSSDPIPWDKIEEEIQRPHNILTQRSETYFIEMERAIEAQKKEFKDESEEYKLKIDSPQILARQYGNEAKRHIQSLSEADIENILHYYNMILSMKTTEIMFDDAKTSFMRKKRIWNSFYEEFYQPLISVLMYLKEIDALHDQDGVEPPKDVTKSHRPISLATIEEDLDRQINNLGVSFLNHQVAIMRKARNLPKSNVDANLATVRFFNTLKMIDDWLAPLAELFQFIESDEQALRDIQNETRYAIQESGLTKWKEIIAQPKFKEAFNDIQLLFSEINKKRALILEKARHSEITQLLGLALYPYSGHNNLSEAIKYAQEKYFGTNIKYSKKNRFIDALICTKATIDIFQKTDRELITQVSTVQVSYDKYLDLFPNLKDVYTEARAGNFQFKGFTLRQVDNLVSRSLKRRLQSSERSMLYNDPYYMPAVDQVRCDLFLQWLDREFHGEKEKLITSAPPKQEVASESAGKEDNYLFGISFLDKHVLSEMLGNVDISFNKLMDLILAPFTSLKQEEMFIESAQFEIELPNVPNQAWIYDFTAIKTAILRSTLFLISNRQPKFDLLEYCQTLVNNVLTGRVDRNDLKSEFNYIYTNLLPRESWDYVGKTLIDILIEVLIDENPISRKIIRNIFVDEDKSKLISSKQFVPVYYLEVEWKVYERRNPYEEVPLPETELISVWKRNNFHLEYRHIEAAGYPWYYTENKVLQNMIKEAYSISRINLTDVQLKRVIYTIGEMEQKYIFYFQASEDQKTLQILAFKEEDVVDGISPVEVIFRPKKFIDRNPEENNLELLVSKARATDPNDLRVLIESL